MVGGERERLVEDPLRARLRLGRRPADVGQVRPRLAHPVEAPQEAVAPARAGGEVERVGRQLEQVARLLRAVVDRRLERRDAPDAARRLLRAGVEQQPHERDVVEARGEAEGLLELAAALDEERC